MATSIGHAPAAGLIDPAAGSVLSIAEALTNIWAPLENKIKAFHYQLTGYGCNNEGEDSRLYKAVKAASDFAIALGINTCRKDSMSMIQNIRIRLYILREP